MFFLHVFGDNLEDRFGHFKYLMLYLFWGVMAAFAHSIYAVATGEGGIPAIGASGAISGVLGAYLIFYPHAKIHTIIFAFFITTVRIPAIAYIPFWFIMLASIRIHRSIRRSCLSHSHRWIHYRLGNKLLDGSSFRICFLNKSNTLHKTIDEGLLYLRPLFQTTHQIVMTIQNL